MQTGSSATLIGYRNLEKPIMSLYGTEWRERGYGLRVGIWYSRYWYSVMRQMDVHLYTPSVIGTKLCGQQALSR